MNNKPSMDSDICAMDGNNLEAILFSDFSNQDSMIITSDISDLSELDGALCYNETTNQLVCVNMIPPQVNNLDLSSVSHPVFSVIENNPSSLTDLRLFHDENQIMLLANDSIFIPNENDSLVTASSDPYILQYVQTAGLECIKENNGQIIIDRLEGKAGSNHQMVDHNYEQVSNDLINRVQENCNPVKPDTKIEEIFYECTLCSKNFIELKKYRTHLFSHKDKVHKCNYCESSFNKLKNLMLHEVIHNPMDLVCPLPICKKKFRRLASLKAHIKLHEEDETLSCTECGEEFRNQMYLELHYKYQPKCRIPDSKVAADVSRSCKLCNRKFSNFNSLAAHKREHDKIKKALQTKSHRKKSSVPSKPSSRINRCKVCPKWFLKPSQLIRHVRIHTGERPFECTQCPKAFNQANSLKIHMLKHTGDRPYLCPFCSSGFSQRGNLRQHINRVHSIPKVEDKMYECSECSCIFRKVCSLNAHRNRVHQQKSKIKLTKSGDKNDMTLNEDSQNSIPNDDHLDVASCKSLKDSIHINNGDKKLSTLKTHLNQEHAKLLSTVGKEMPESGSSITVENNLDDVDDDDWNHLLRKNVSVTTVVVSVDKGKGELWNQNVYITRKNRKRYYQCSHCPKRTSKLSELIRHIKVNVVGQSFKCEYCAQTFTQQSTFLTHVMLHLAAKTYKCQLCQQNFPNPAELNIHSLSHKKENSGNSCVSCFKSLIEGEKHHCTFSKRVPDDVEVKNVQDGTSGGVQRLHDKINLILPPYTCSHCNRMFETYSKLKSHLLEHKSKLCNEREIKTVGNKKFRNKKRRGARLMSQSSVVADEESQNNCFQCGKNYKDVKALSRHLKKMHEINNETVLIAKSISASSDSVILENIAMKTFSATESVIDISGNVSKFIIHGDNPVSITTDQSKENIASINYTVPVDDSLSLNTHIISNSVPILNDTMCANDEKLSDSITIDTLDDGGQMNKNSISFDVTGNSLEDCFIGDQVEDLPRGSAFDSTSAVYNLPGIVNYRCSTCAQQFTNELDLHKHINESPICNNGIMSHSLNYFYACNTCYLTFKTVPAFLRHLQTHNGSGTYSCLYCNTPNKTEAELTHHISQHALNKEYPCIHCGELYESAGGVKKHITETHLRSSLESKSVESKRKKSACNELLLSEKQKLMFVEQEPNKFSSISEKVLSSLLKGSIKNDESNKNEMGTDESKNTSKTKRKQSNLNVKENICNYCSRSFKKMCDLIRHVRTHTGERPYKCDYCNKCFTVKSILNGHLKRHFTVKNIFCHVCNRLFSTVGSLKIHMRLHTGDRPYKCMYCKETFRTSGHRESHQKRHLSEKVKSKQPTIESAMIETQNDYGLGFVVGELNMQDENFLMTDVFKFHEGINMASLNNQQDSFQCSVCNNTFKKKSDLNEHSNIHLENSSYVCEICDTRFSLLSALKTHVKKHASVSIPCVLCGRKFASEKNLKIHKICQHPQTLENMPFKDNDEPISGSGIRMLENLNRETENETCVAGLEDTNKYHKWAHQEDLSLSALVGKGKKSASLSDSFNMANNFDMISFPNEEK